MKKSLRSAAIIIFTTICIGLILFSGFLTGNIIMPSELTQSAQSVATTYARVTAQMEEIDAGLTKMALEPELTSIPSPSVTSQNWLEQFFYNPTCQIPCWENITPNETNIDTAIKIVSRIPEVRIISFNSKGVGWYFNDESSNSGYIVANQDGIVLQISLWSRNGKTVPLKDVIESYGSPVAVLEGTDCDYIFSYRYQGMLLFTTDTSCSRKPVWDMTPNTPVDQIILFSPENQEYTLNMIPFHIDEIIWDGYKTYDFTDK